MSKANYENILSEFRSFFGRIKDIIIYFQDLSFYSVDPSSEALYNFFFHTVFCTKLSMKAQQSIKIKFNFSVWNT